MSKNYADIYNSKNDSISLNQRFYLVEEDVRGVMKAPQDTDYFYHLPGSQINYEQGFEPSPQRSGRHITAYVKGKVSATWTIESYFNYPMDNAIAVLLRSALGNQSTNGQTSTFDISKDPDTTFTVMEVGDMWARQAPGAFVNTFNPSFPGDSEARMVFSGNAKNGYFASIAKSSTENTSAFTCDNAGEAKRFSVGAAVMVIKSNGLDRSSDTADGSFRTIEAIDPATGAISLSGADLTDATGTESDPVYLVYYEPANPAATNNPLTGLDGEIQIKEYPSIPVRNISLTLNNNHELQDQYYGTSGLSGALFVPGSRAVAESTFDVTLNKETAALFNDASRFEAIEATVLLANNFSIKLPRVQLRVPGFSVPDQGSVVVSFSGICMQKNTPGDEVQFTTGPNLSI